MNAIAYTHTTECRAGRPATRYRARRSFSANEMDDLLQAVEQIWYYNDHRAITEVIIALRDEVVVSIGSLVSLDSPNCRDDANRNKRDSTTSEITDKSTHSALLVSYVLKGSRELSMGF